MTSILQHYESFRFSVIPCPLFVAHKHIIEQCGTWKKTFEISQASPFDVRLIYEEPEGPRRTGGGSVGILLREIVIDGLPRTVYVCSYTDGYASLLSMVSEKIPGVFFTFRVSRLDVLYPMNMMKAFERNEISRFLYAMKDPRWKFWESGRPLPFEETSLYKSRLLRDRLNPNVISEYLSWLNFPSLDESFWISKEPGYLLCQRDFRLGLLTRT